MGYKYTRGWGSGRSLTSCNVEIVLMPNCMIVLVFSIVLSCTTKTDFSLSQDSSWLEVQLKSQMGENGRIQVQRSAWSRSGIME